ncbi:hypothetical protein CsSME_00019990 [Camellia sinensis var. sinensis]
MSSSYHATEDGEQLYLENLQLSKQITQSQRCAACTRYSKEPDLWIVAEQEWV